jgi:hypothetical protein
MPSDLPDPTPAMLADPRFAAVWEKIKGWDISTDPAGTTERLYSGATGNHVRAILDALDALEPAAR